MKHHLFLLITRLAIIFLALLIISSATHYFSTHSRQASVTPTVSAIRSAVADPVLLQNRYNAWKQKIQSRDAPHLLRFTLVAADSHQRHGLASAAGVVELDAQSGAITARVNAVSTTGTPALWVTEQASLYATNTRTEDMHFIGALQNEGEQAVLHSDLSVFLQEGRHIGQFVIAPLASNPLQHPLLAASPTLFQKLLAAEASSSHNGGGFDLITPVAHAAEATGFPDVFGDLVTQGEDVFFNETFAGNGRSCATCHAATNNFTIDTDFIASLPANDPLFVAEFVPALIFGNPANLDSFGNPRRLENPALMRAFGLIVENQDGMNDLENIFNMRSVPHNIGMSVSIDAPPNDLTPPADRTGWSGEGAPSGIIGGIATSGRLRDFIVGAVVQHYPKTLDRSFTGPNPDFRAPTLQEIDALEAFLLALGRQADLELRDGFPGQLQLKDASAEAGKLLFRDGVAGGTTKCQNCHGNAGANVLTGANPGNRNFNTGVELFLRNRLTDANITVVGEPRPADGGFGTNPSGDFNTLTAQAGFTGENFGDGRFNTPSLVEAANTAPFFHNNIIDTLEGAIAFYNSAEFLQASGNKIPFTAAEITKVANFLRVINAIDNVESSALRQADRALTALGQSPVPNDVISRILQIMIADTNDAIGVLEQGNIHNSGGLPVNAVKQLDKAVNAMQQAMNTNAAISARSNHLNTAKSHLNTAVGLMKF